MKVDQARARQNALRGHMTPFFLQVLQNFPLHGIGCSQTHMAALTAEHDAVEAIVPLMPIVLPVGGAVLIFLLAFIAVFMA